MALFVFTGAGVFVTTVVAGGIALLKPFTVASRPFLRDAVFYMVAVFLTFTMVYFRRITLAGALSKSPACSRQIWRAESLWPSPPPVGALLMSARGQLVEGEISWLRGAAWAGEAESEAISPPLSPSGQATSGCTSSTF